jgi:hypothetical protein
MLLRTAASAEHADCPLLQLGTPGDGPAAEVLASPGLREFLGGARRPRRC